MATENHSRPEFVKGHCTEKREREREREKENLFFVVRREERMQRVIIGELGSSKALYPSRHSLSWPATIVR